MIFAIITEDKTLEVFDSESDAISYAEGVDVEDGIWLFFDEAGQALEPLFTKPNKRGNFVIKSGVYELRSTSNNLPPLQHICLRFPRLETQVNLTTYLKLENGWLLSDHSSGSPNGAR